MSHKQKQASGNPTSEKVQSKLSDFKQVVTRVVKKDKILAEDDEDLLEVVRMHNSKQQLDISQLESGDKIKKMQDQIEKDGLSMGKNDLLAEGAKLDARQEEVNALREKWRQANAAISLVKSVELKASDTAKFYHHAHPSLHQRWTKKAAAEKIMQICKDLLMPYNEAMAAIKKRKAAAGLVGDTGSDVSDEPPPVVEDSSEEATTSTDNGDAQQPCPFGEAEPTKKHKAKVTTASTGQRKEKNNGMLKANPITKSIWEARIKEQDWVHPETKAKHKDMCGKWQKPFCLKTLIGKPGLYIFCNACAEYVNKTRLKQHMNKKGHHKLVEKKRTTEKQNQQTLGEVMKLKDPKGGGSSIGDNNEAWRIKFTQAAFTANISIGQLAILAKQLAGNFREGLTMGDVKTNAQKYTHVINKIEKDRIREAIKGCYPEFATISDGTPKDKKFEAIKIRLVRKQDGKVLEFLAHVRTHKEGVTSRELAINFCECINDMGLDFKSWLFAIVDRAATNKKCIKAVCDSDRVDATPSVSFCDSHGIVKPGEAMLANATYFKELREKWNAAIQHPTSGASKDQK